MDQQFKPITIVGLNSKKEIEFDINLVMKMFHAYIAYLPIEQRSPQEQLLLSKQLIAIQDLYNDEQKAAIEYIQKKADEDAVEEAGINVHYKEKGPEEQNIDDLLDSVRIQKVATIQQKAAEEVLNSKERLYGSKKPLKLCENCEGAGELPLEGIPGYVPCIECGGSGYAK